MNSEELLQGIDCTGCSACSDACGCFSISMIENEEGFLVPSVEDSKCVDCRECYSICPSRNRVLRRYPQKGYVAYTTDCKVYPLSSSGGVFGKIASNYLEKGWYTVGAAFDDDFDGIHHIVINNSSDLSRIQGSKYIQSNVEGVYKQVKQLLKDREKVLFSGTPCQVAGLYKVLKEDYAKQLYTIEIICHGVSNFRLFKKSFINQHKRSSQKITNISFRMKDAYERTGFNLCVQYCDGVHERIPNYKDLYYSLYLRGLSYRESCYTCQYAAPERVGDMTIGDCNTYQRYSISSDKVLSIVLINTEKGNQLWGENKDSFCYELADIDAEIKGNAQLSHPVIRPDERNTVLENWNQSLSVMKQKYMKFEFKQRVYYVIKRSIKLKTRIKIKKRLTRQK